VRLPWLAHNEASVLYTTIPKYRFNKTKQHTLKDCINLSNITDIMKSLTRLESITTSRMGVIEFELPLNPLQNI